ncbi:Hypothetical_protein [Hexamita inflata]|uniref:Hypothetical_protein n=1 Tax=Hexamita inflata TaxID=28002 RepID=A0AA86UEW8_9EUKA|nr:Hypothetical protein HINF_LOCUS43110 [Hexamita inflata]
MLRILGSIKRALVVLLFPVNDPFIYMIYTVTSCIQFGSFFQSVTIGTLEVPAYFEFNLLSDQIVRCERLIIIRRQTIRQQQKLEKLPLSLHCSGFYDLVG